MNFNITSWFALSPGLIEQNDWFNWSQKSKSWPVELTPVPANLIKPMMRRRMSSLSKLALQSALQVSENELLDYIIFSSRHGELTRTVKLLQDIIAGEDASPMAFSQSVHNTASGLFTIATKRALPVTSLAALEDSLHSALIEAYIYLQENPQHRVLLVDFDEPLPAPYQQYETQNYQGFALAMLLTAGEQYQLSYSKNSAGVAASLPHAFELIDFLINKQESLIINSKSKQWSWIKNNDDLATT